LKIAHEGRRNWITIRLLDYDNKKCRIVLGTRGVLACLCAINVRVGQNGRRGHLRAPWRTYPIWFRSDL